MNPTPINPVLELMAARKSVRSYTDQPVEDSVKACVLDAVLRGPTAGNMMLYSVIEVTGQDTKERLAVTCDHQPFIAKAPWVLLFLADYQRWYDYYTACNIDPLRTPEQGELFLACCDAMIAAQNAVLAAESLGLGSCYIGDIMENYEIHKDLFNLPRFVFPITLVCFGYPTAQQKNRPLTPRYDKEFIVFKDTYRRLDNSGFEKMFKDRQAQIFKDRTDLKGARNMGEYMFQKKYDSTFQAEMNRSVRLILDRWFSTE